MGTMNRTTLPKDLEPGINAHFGDAYRMLPDEWTGVFDTESTVRAWEEDVLTTGMGAAAVKAEGGPVTYDQLMQGWTARYDVETIALACRITEEAVEDNLYYSLAPKIGRALARALKHTKEIKGATVLNNATSDTGGDGVSLLNTAHPLLGGGTLSNKLATAADISESSVEDILIQIRKCKDDRNVPMALRAVRVIVPPELEYDAHRIFESPLRPGTADNDANAIRDMGIFTSRPHIVTRLTDSDQWFIKTDCPDGLKYFRRLGVQRGMMGEFETGDARYKVRERYVFGYSDWRAIWGSEGAT